MYKLNSIDVKIDNYDVIERYEIDQVKVFITSDGRYLIQEPFVDTDGSELYNEIIKKINLGVGFGPDSNPEELAEMFEDSFWDVAGRLERKDEARRMFTNIKYYIRRELIGFDIIDVLMRDPMIEDILCSAPARNIRVNHKKYSGKFHTLETNIKFADSTDMERFIQKVFGRTGSEPTEAQPISVSYMTDGSRISVTRGSQVTKPGPIVAIRKFPASPFTITHMIRSGSLSAEMAAYLWTMLDAKAVGLVIGVTGSGKTTLLASLVSMMNPRWRILTIEDTLELQIPHSDWVRYNTRKSYGMLAEKYDISMRHLIDSSLTQKPDYEIIGEIRINDMDMLFQSVGTGHGGLTSFHASTADGALTRMRGAKISDGELALIWFIVHSSVVILGGQKTRRVTNISEVVADGKTGEISTVPIFKYDIFEDKFTRTMKFMDSRRYREAVRICGITDPESDMQKRISLLERCVREDADEMEKVFEILGRYYD